MKVAVVSDTHGCLSMLDRCIKLAGQVDVWCHLGDLTSDAEALMSRTNAKVMRCAGIAIISEARRKDTRAKPLLSLAEQES